MVGGLEREVWEGTPSALKPQILRVAHSQAQDCSRNNVQSSMFIAPKSWLSGNSWNDSLPQLPTLAASFHSALLVEQHSKSLVKGWGCRMLAQHAGSLGVCLQHSIKLDVVAHTCDPRTGEVEAERSAVQDCPQLHRQLKAILGHRRPYLKKKKDLSTTIATHLLSHLILQRRNWVFLWGFQWLIRTNLSDF